MFAFDIVRSQFLTLPYPETDCTDKIVVVTGSNVGLGLEAARHFVRLNAAKVILACRDLERAEIAKKDIEESTGRQDVVEVWHVDLSAYESVKEFAARVDKLERLDVFINNASILMAKKELFEGHEAQITVNVISTLLLSVLILPALRRSAQLFNVTPHLVIVSSDASNMAAPFSERNAEHIIQALDAKTNILDQYNVTKLLQLMFMKRLAEGIDASGKGHIIVNSLNPGLCKTQLFRNYTFPLGTFVWLLSTLFGREPEVGSRTLMAAAFAGEETHGNWMTDCRLYEWPRFMVGDEGEKLTSRVWSELLEILEGIQPGVTQLI